MSNNMPALLELEKLLTRKEKTNLEMMNTPVKIQYFLDSIPYSSESIYRCPLQVLRERIGHCFDGALFAAAALRRIGHPAIIMDLLPNQRDDDHVLALFKEDKHWGAIAKSNFTGLRFREPIFRSLRELVLSYFEQYYNTAREKTLRAYTQPLNLKVFDHLGWMYSNRPLHLIAGKLDNSKRFPLLTRGMITRLQSVDPLSYRAGLVGADKKGLFKPGT
jgi:hypothetical protein